MNPTSEREEQIRNALKHCREDSYWHLFDPDALQRCKYSGPPQFTENDLSVYLVHQHLVPSLRELVQRSSRGEPESMAYLFDLTSHLVMALEELIAQPDRRGDFKTIAQSVGAWPLLVTRTDGHLQEIARWLKEFGLPKPAYRPSTKALKYALNLWQKMEEVRHEEANWQRMKTYRNPKAPPLPPVKYSRLERQIIRLSVSQDSLGKWVKAAARLFLQEHPKPELDRQLLSDLCPEYIDQRTGLLRREHKNPTTGELNISPNIVRKRINQQISSAFRSLAKSRFQTGLVS